MSKNMFRIFEVRLLPTTLALAMQVFCSHEFWIMFGVNRIPIVRDLNVSRQVYVE